MAEEFKWTVVDEMPPARNVTSALDGPRGPLYRLVLELAKPEVQESPVIRLEWDNREEPGRALSALGTFFRRNLLDWQPVIRTRGNTLYIQIKRLPEGQSRSYANGQEKNGKGSRSQYAEFHAEIDKLEPGQSVVKKLPPSDAAKYQSSACSHVGWHHPDWKYETHTVRPTKDGQPMTLYITRNA
jgi:hypothetical protein